MTDETRARWPIMMTKMNSCYYLVMALADRTTAPEVAVGDGVVAVSASARAHELLNHREPLDVEEKEVWQSMLVVRIIFVFYIFGGCLLPDQVLISLPLVSCRSLLMGTHILLKMYSTCGDIA